MSDERRCWWDDVANRGIVGIGPAPWVGEFAWPTEGYDGQLRGYEWDADGPFAQTGVTKAEWLELADAMIARWQAWKLHVESLPEAPHAEGDSSAQREPDASPDVINIAPTFACPFCNALSTNTDESYLIRHLETAHPA